MEVVLFKIRTRSDLDASAYEEAFVRMMELVAQVPGFVSLETYAGEDGTELALAAFEDEQAIATWREQPEHVATRRRGREEFFEAYEITIASVTRRYDWQRDASSAPATSAPDTSA